VNLHTVALELPPDGNLIVGQAHFIKTAEDLAEIVAVIPGARYGIAFCEASGPRLIRTEGNEPALVALAAENARRVGAGHAFYIALAGIFPITVLEAVKRCPEVCRVFCATGNPVEAIVAETDQGRGILGVVDGQPPLGLEDDAARTKRREFLRAIGYKK